MFRLQKHTCSFSHTFFFGLSLSSGFLESYPSTKTCSPGDEPSGGSRGSTLLGSPSLQINQGTSKESKTKSWVISKTIFVQKQHSHRGTQQHGLRLNPSHLLGLQIAKHQHHSVLQVLLWDIGHQPTDYGPWLRFPNVNLLQVQGISIWMLQVLKTELIIWQHEHT